MHLKNLPLFFFLLLSHLTWGQYSITGKVLDEQGEPLIGATIMVHELNRGTVTQLNGSYQLNNLKPAHYHLHVNFVGYESVVENVLLNEDKQIDFRLSSTSLELNEIVIESNHYKTGPKEQTLSMEIVDKNYLRKNRKGSLVNSLEDLPGINAINTGVGISKPVIRGMSFNRVIVNDQGIKQEGQQWGTDHGLEIDLFSPGRVEIIKGPSSLMYGSDGLGGVINIFPEPIPNAGEMKGELQTLYKSNNHLYGGSVMVENDPGDHVYRFRLSHQQFGDYRVPANSFIYNSFNLPLYDGILKNTAGSELNFSAMGGIKKDWGYSTVTVSNFHQKAGLFAGAIGIPREYQLTPDGNLRNIDLPRQVINHFKVISNTNLLVANNWLELDLGYQYNYRREESEPHAHGKGPRPEGILAHGLRLQTFTLNARYFKKLNRDHSRIFGVQGQYQINTREGFEFLLPQFNAANVGVFVYEEWSWADAFTFNGGIRFDYGNREISSFQEPIYRNETDIERYYQRNPNINRTFYNFSGGAGLSFYPNKRFNAKVNIGSSFRQPTPAALSMHGIHHGTFRHEMGDSTLSAERGYQLDLSFSYLRPQVSIVLTPYVSWYQNYIYLAPTSRFSSSLDPQAFPEGGQIYQYRQHDTFFGGGELSVEYHPIPSLHLKTGTEYVYNYNFDTFLPLPFTPPLSVLFDANLELPIKSRIFSQTSFGANVKHGWPQNRVDRNEMTTPGYTLVGLSAGTNLQAFGESFDFVASAQNLLNTQYFNHLSRYRLLNLPEQGRNITVSLIYSF
jgi:iron complex outermembrane receptor protein